MRSYDAIVVGAGPAGSIAALVLARAGVSVALVDRREFPREKACGDLIGPRGVRLLSELDIDFSDGLRIDDMVVIAPNGRRTLLPALPGEGYADHARSVTRDRFDASLHDLAVTAGADPIQARVTDLVRDGEAIRGVRLQGGETVHADVVIGADGSNSTVARDAGLVDDARVLWGFALRAYVDGSLDLPHIVLWEPRRWELFPGYGWAFPVDGGGLNVGLGLALGGADRSVSRRAGGQLGDFLAHLERLGVVMAGPPRSRSGGWLKLGMLGTVPTGPGVLLVGDAAGLVNSLQGEGIAQAMASGRAAAEAVLAAGPRDAGPHYLAYLRGVMAHHRANAPIHAGMVKHPLAVSVTARVLSAPGVGPAIAGAWGLYWNDLVHDADPSRHRRLATGALAAITAAGRRSSSTRWFDTHFAP